MLANLTDLAFHWYIQKNKQLCSYNSISRFCSKHRRSSFCRYSGCIIAGKLDLIVKLTAVVFYVSAPKLSKKSGNIFGNKKKKLLASDFFI